jgi:hypothetical protein
MSNDLEKRENILAKTGSQLDSKGLIISKEIDFKDWQELGSLLRFMKGRVQIWLGDWLNYGERSYGEMYTQAIEETDYEYGSLKDFKSVMGRVEKSMRTDFCTYSHYRLIVATPNIPQWIKIATDEKLSTRELAERIKFIHKKETPKEKIKDDIRKEIKTIFEYDEVAQKKVETIFLNRMATLHSTIKKDEEIIKAQKEKISELNKTITKLSSEIKKYKADKEHLKSKIDEELAPDASLREYTDFWNSINKRYFNHVMFERKKKDGKIISDWTKIEMSRIKSISKKGSFETFKKILEYMYKSDYWCDKTEPAMVQSKYQMILKQIKSSNGGVKKDISKIAGVMDSKDAPSKTVESDCEVREIDDLI